MKNGIISVILTIGFVLLQGHPIQAQQVVWSHFTGHPGCAGNADGVGAAARFQNPNSLAVDSNGTVYVADTGNNTIRKLVFSGTNSTVSTLAGTVGVTGLTDGTGVSAQFNTPSGIAVDGNGIVYVADSGNYTIRKITPEGVVTTFAGIPGQSGNSDGPGALFGCPMGIAVDGNGTVYVADSFNHTIRKITSGGSVTTLAGCPNVMGSRDGTGSSASFNTPGGVTVDASGTVFVADTLNHTIRKITPDGTVTTLAGTPGQYGSIDGTGNRTQFNTPSALVVDGAGSLYVADTYNDTIRKVSPAGVVTTVSGSASTTGFTDGAGSAALYNFPAGIAIDSNGNVYVADTGNHTIRKEIWSVVTTVAGSAPQPGHNGSGIYGFLNSPTQSTLDASGNLYVADTGNQVIIKCTGTGNSLVAGQMLKTGTTDAAGSSAAFNYPQGIAIDSGTNLYVSDSWNHTIRKISVVSGSGAVTTICGSPANQGSADGSGANAMFNSPIGIAVDSGTNLYVADTYNNTIRKLSFSGSAWKATTIAGTSGVTGTTDGSGSLFSQPNGVAVDGNGTVYVADTLNHTIRTLTLSGSTWTAQTIAGTPAVSGTADGDGGSAQFNHPTQLTFDPKGNLFVVDTGNSSVRMLTKTGGNWGVSTVGGTPGTTGGVAGFMGVGPQAQFSAPMGIAVGTTSMGTDLLYVVDSENNRIAMGAFAGTGAANTVTLGSANLTGMVDPNGLDTKVYFQYGTTTGYGNTTGTQSIGSGTNFVAVNSAINGLSGNKTYNYRIVIINSSGTYYGLNQTFVTLPSAIPSVTSVKLISGTNGFPLSYTTVATNAPTGFAANPLPMGLTMNPLTGVISGIPTVTASTNTTVSVTNTFGTVTTSIAINIINLPLPVFTCSGSAAAIYEAAFNYNIGATNSVSSYDATGLPPGCKVVNSSGLIRGTPTTMGTYAVSLFAINATGTSTMPLSITVAPPYVWSNFAGKPGVYGSTNGTGNKALFNGPEGIVVDSGSNIYVADTLNLTIRKITPAGVVTTFAGSVNKVGNVNGTGTNATFSNPTGLAIDSSSNLYVADYFNNQIRKITPAGVVTTLAGSGLAGMVNGTGTNASFFCPTGVAVDSGSNVYVTDTQNHAIRMITPQGVVTTLAGSLSSSTGSVDGVGTAARFNQPSGIAVDSGSNVYVVDTTNCAIRKITPAKVVTTIAGVLTNLNYSDGIGPDAAFINPRGIAIDSGTNLYVTDGYYVIRKIVPTNGTWAVNTIGGTWAVSGSADGIGTAGLNYDPAAITMSNSGILYVADTSNHRIFSGNVMQVPAITSTLSASGTVGVTFRYNIGATLYPQNYSATGLVSGLTLNSTTGVITGKPTVSGTYSLGICATNLVGTGSTTVTLAINPVPTAYQKWQALVFNVGQLATPSVSNDVATPAGDGISNLMKYALHLNPLTNGVSGLPVQSISTISGNNYLSLAYTKVIAATDLIYTVQISTDLKTWNSGPGYTGIMSTVANPDGVTQTVTVQSLIPLTAGTSKQFIRLQVSH